MWTTTTRKAAGTAAASARARHYYYYHHLTTTRKTQNIGMIGAAVGAVGAVGVGIGVGIVVGSTAPNKENETYKDNNNNAASSSTLLSLSSILSSSSLSTLPFRRLTTFCEAASKQSSSKSSTTSTYDNDNTNKTTTTTTNKIVFLGTGSSTGCPKPICIMQTMMNNPNIMTIAGGLTSSSNNNKSTTTNTTTNTTNTTTTTNTNSLPKIRCHVSQLALSSPNDPKFNKNYRNNPCLLLHIDNQNILFDVGKTFREGALRWLPHLQINTTIDAIVLTHHHMDAAAGLDDLRGFQGITQTQQSKNSNENGDMEWTRISMPVYLSHYCHEQLQSQFPWLFPKPQKSQEDENNNSTAVVVVKRDVASLQTNLFENYQPLSNFPVKNVQIIPLPVWHGDDLISHGFIISIPKTKKTTTKTKTTTNIDNDNIDIDNDDPLFHILYLSDISKMVPETTDYLKKHWNNKIDLFICDALLWHNTHPVHYSLEQAVELSQQSYLRPKLGTYLIGMNCDDFLPHDEMNDLLRKMYNKNNNNKNEEGEDGNTTTNNNKNPTALVQLAHDGLVIEV